MARESEISIRRAVAGDTAAIASVLHRSFAEFQPLYTEAAFRATTASSEQIATRMAEGPVWIALGARLFPRASSEHSGRANAEISLEAGTVVGTVSAVPRGDALYVRGMAVLPSARGKGVARLLLAQVEQAAAAGAHTRLVLSTTPFLSAAIRLYEGAGFRYSDEGPRDLFGTPLLTMAKPLGGAVR